MTEDSTNRIPRSEATRLLMGRGRFLDSVSPPHMLHLAFVRSPVAHAKLTKVDVSTAMAMPGVVGVFRAEDFATVMAEIPQTKLDTMPGHVSPPQPPLVAETIRYQGEPVAVVAAETLARAVDAAEVVTLDYETLPANTSISSVAGQTNQIASAVEIGAGLPEIDNVVRLEGQFVFGRQTGVTLEPRGIVADYDPAEARLNVWHSHQSPHMVAALLARILGLPENKVRVQVGDVGGGFGVKLHLYPDEIAAALVARLLGRPVKFVASRVESFQSDAHAREFEATASISLTAEGELIGFEGDFTNAIGAYSMYPRASVGDAMQAAVQLGAPYQIQGIKTAARTLWQNKPPSGPIRGVGQPIPCTVTEQLMDMAARHLGEDPAQFRRRHYLAAEAFPLTTQSGLMMDRLSLTACLDAVLDEMSYDALRTEQQKLRGQGILRGIGLATFIEQTAVGPRLYGGTGIPATSIEECHIRLESDGSVRVDTGATDQGQGTLTGIRQIVAGILGMDISSIDVAAADSAGARGGGAWASRGLSLAGEAAYLAAETLRDNILQVAAGLLQSDPASLSLARGEIRGAGEESLQLEELARTAWYQPYDLPDGATDLFSVSRSYTLEGRPYLVTNGIQGSLVEVDAETGAVDVLKQWVVDDCGNIINSALVDGQIMGGSAQGIGGALGERLHYDASGQLLSGSFLDYPMPRADSTPPMQVRHIVTPQVGTKLGVKGVGEAGTIGAPAAIWGAVNDAIAHLGARVTSQPITAESVYRAVSNAKP